MTDLTLNDIKNVKAELKALEPAKKLDGNRKLNSLEAITALYPALERMQNRGFTIDEILEKLREKGIEVAPSTYEKYMGKCRKKKLQDAQANAVKKGKAVEPVNPVVADLEDAVRPSQLMPDEIAERRDVQVAVAAPENNAAATEIPGEPVPAPQEEQKPLVEVLPEKPKRKFVVQKNGDLLKMVYGDDVPEDVKWGR